METGEEITTEPGISLDYTKLISESNPFIKGVPAEPD
ncbi:MAG: hypothetical protein Ct9H300mP2_3360 [Candidatus Neomarinimicrobiota bacterium]|nr:MAG: hypothetical protein Ct9H300mP2_3360 [Candidatus Neomarinimicrobiota bacterium]